MKTSSPRIPIALIGLSFGQHILKLLQQSPACELFELKAVCDQRREVADKVASLYKVKAYYNINTLLADSSIPLIGLFTGPHGRARLLRQILDAGKDILTTKPFELDGAEARSVLNYANELERIIYLNSPSPFPTHDLLQIENWKKEFNLGQLVSARGEVWASYFEEADGTWMDDPRLCPGGSMMRLGIYLINDILQIAGTPSNIKFTSSHIRTGRPTADNALLTMICGDSGCLASVYASFCVDDGDNYTNGLILNFERGTIYRNMGAVRRVAVPDEAHLSLVMRQQNKRAIVAEKTFQDCSGTYQWDSLHQAITQRHLLKDSQIDRIVGAVQVLDQLRKIPQSSTVQRPLVAA